MDSLNTTYEAFKDYLDHLMAGKETACVEFKYGKGGFTQEFWPTYSSFANTDGGVIIIGVKEKQGKFYPEGLSAETVNQYEKIFWDSVNDPNQVSRKLLTNNDVIKDEYNGSHFLAFFVPRAAREERPVYVGQNPMKSTYSRNASGDYLWKLGRRICIKPIGRCFRESSHFFQCRFNLKEMNGRMKQRPIKP